MVSVDKIEYGTDLINSCLLPELIHEIGFQHLTDEHFDNFREKLDYQLTKLFDFLQLNENILLEKENQTLELRSRFLILLCEQTASDTLFQIREEKLQNNLKLLLNKYFEKLVHDDEKLVEEIKKYFTQKLRSDYWKKNIGAVHAFETFCQLFYMENQHSIDPKSCNFTLSVGLLLNDFYEPQYKGMSYKLFHIILERTDESTIKDMNIHNVIFDVLFKNTANDLKEQILADLWKCIYQCAELFEIKSYSKWNEIDDILDAVIRRISFNSDLKSFLLLFSYLPKFVLLSETPGNKRIKYDQESTDTEENWPKLRERCSSLSVPATFRWAKKILKLIISESNRLFDNPDNTFKILNAMQFCYLICIFSVHPNIIENHLVEFLNKFPLVLMEVLRTNRNCSSVVAAIKEFIKTINYHLVEISDKSKLMEYHDALNKILNNEIFLPTS